MYVTASDKKAWRQLTLLPATERMEQFNPWSVRLAQWATLFCDDKPQLMRNSSLSLTWMRRLFLPLLLTRMSSSLIWLPKWPVVSEWSVGNAVECGKFFLPLLLSAHFQEVCEQDDVKFFLLAHLTELFSRHCQECFFRFQTVECCDFSLSLLLSVHFQYCLCEQDDAKFFLFAHLTDVSCG